MPKKNKWWPLTTGEYHKLIKRVNEGDAVDAFGDPCVGPKDETDAVKLTIAKWHPSREGDVGNSDKLGCGESCGCCAYYDCYACILNIDATGSDCLDEGVAFKYACKRLAELTE